MILNGHAEETADATALLAVWASDPETERSAALTVCGQARDANDARWLCRALGLVPDPESRPPVMLPCKREKARRALRVERLGS